jgi:hypothetical protein
MDTVQVGQVWQHKGNRWQVVCVAGTDVSLQFYPPPSEQTWDNGVPIHPVYNRSKFAHADAMRVSADWRLL